MGSCGGVEMKYETREKLITTAKLTGALIVGLLGGHAATQYAQPAANTAKAAPVSCSCQCITPKPDPIKVEFVQPGRK